MCGDRRRKPGILARTGQPLSGRGIGQSVTHRRVHRRRSAPRATNGASNRVVSGRRSSELTGLPAAMRSATETARTMEGAASSRAFPRAILVAALPTQVPEKCPTDFRREPASHQNDRQTVRWQANARVLRAAHLFPSDKNGPSVARRVFASAGVCARGRGDNSLWQIRCSSMPRIRRRPG